MSFPRDLMVPMPECTREDGTKASIRHGTGTRTQAVALAKLVPGATTVRVPAPGTLDLVIGADFTGVRTSAGVPVQ